MKVIESKIPINTKIDNHLVKNYTGKNPWPLILIFLLLSSLVWYLGNLYYKTQRGRIQSEKQNVLSSIADLKINEIDVWKNERLRDVETFVGNSLTGNALSSYLKNPDSKRKQEINIWFETLIKNFDYRKIILLNSSGNPVLRIPENENDENDDLDFSTGNNINSTEKSEFHLRNKKDGGYLIFIQAPVKNYGIKENNAIGTMIFELDPEKQLFPLLQKWQSSNVTSEIIIFTKNDSSYIYLSNPKFKDIGLPKISETKGNTKSVIEKSFLDTTGVVEGLDYRGNEVIAMKKEVPFFNWYLIVKVDKDEIFSGINERAKLVTLLIFAIILIQGILLVQFWRHQKLKYYKSKYQYQLEKEALTKHFNFMFKYANDAIILSDENGQIVEANDKAYSLYGYLKEEFLSMHIYNLRTPETKSQYYKIFEEVNEKGGIVIEAIHVKKDGKKINIENSLRVIDIDGIRYYQSIIRDITERKETEKKIIESESELRALFSSMKDLILVLDKESKILKIAQSNLDLLYKPPKELIGKTLSETIPQNQAELFKSYCDIVFKTKKSINVEYNFPIRNKLMWFDATLAPLGEEKVILVARDVTERKLKESKIEQLTRIYKVLSNVNHTIVRTRDVVELFNKVCRVIVEDGKFNLAWIGIINDTNGQLEVKAKYGHNIEYIERINLNVNYEKNYVGPVLISLSNGKNSICNNIDVEYKITNPPWRESAIQNGFKSVASFAIKSLGKPIGVLVVYSTVESNFRENEIELLDELASNLNFALEFFEKEDLIRKLSSGIEYSFASIAITDLNGVIEFVNPKFTESSGYSVEELIGNDIRILRPKDMWKDEDVKLWDILKEKGEWSGELPIQKKTGEVFWEFAVMSPIKNDKGDVTHLLSVKEDITKRKQGEEELKIAKERAEEANKMKSNFLANMSHELRTPMTGILGFAELMYNEILDKELKDMAGMILKGGMRLTDTLNSILDLSSIEANKIEINVKEKNIVDLIKDSIKLFEINAKQKGITVNFLPDKDTPKARIDERLFIQVMNNLLNNAIKFTEIGEIKILCGRYESDEKVCTFIKVKDTGIGIMQRDIEKIFEPFRQVSEGLSRKYEGTGLGLTISKKFIELMGGYLTVESKVNKGSIFTVYLPVGEESASAQSSKIKDEVNYEKSFDIKPNVLHVEDDLLGRKVVKVLLKRECKITDVEDGETAILIAKKEKFDLVLMDINLRGISGLETVAALRTIPGYEKIPIIAVTAYAMVGDKEEFIRNGCTHYLSKPFTKESLIKIIQEALNT
jgi:PAS domain S-box-containing protein